VLLLQPICADIQLYFSFPYNYATFRIIKNLKLRHCNLLLNNKEPLLIAEVVNGSTIDYSHATYVREREREFLAATAKISKEEREKRERILAAYSKSLIIN
jgi:hypothetical protein